MTIDQKNALAGVVSIDKDVMHGTPCFAHTRFPYRRSSIFWRRGETINDFLAVCTVIRREHVFLISASEPRYRN